MSIPIQTISQIAEQRGNPFFGQASVYLQETWTPHHPSAELFSALAEIMMTYHHAEDIESAMVSLLPPILQVADSQFGFLAEVCYSLGGEPYLLSHAVIDIYKPNYTHQDILSNLQFHNLDTLNGAVMTSKGPVLSNDPKNDPRSGGVPFGHGKIKSYLGLPFLVEEELVGAVALANRADGYRWSDVDLLMPLCRVAGLLIADWRSSR